MTKPKILFLDIETFPNLAYVWGVWQQDVIAKKDSWSIACYAYAFDDRPVLWVKGDEAAMMHHMASILDQADIVVAHNGDEFDVKRVNARLLYHGIKPPSPYKTVDTLKVLKKHFHLDSNKLADVGPYLGLGKKRDTGGFKLWLGCLSNDTKSWAAMNKYNVQDVVLLRKVYKKLLPWISNHPTVGIYMGAFVCPKCGSSYLRQKGFRHNKTTVTKRFLCMKCGGWSCTSTRKNAIPTAI